MARILLKILVLLHKDSELCLKASLLGLSCRISYGTRGRVLLSGCQVVPKALRSITVISRGISLLQPINFIIGFFYLLHKVFLHVLRLVDVVDVVVLLLRTRCLVHSFRVSRLYSERYHTAADLYGLSGLELKVDGRLRQD
jgi:hypothetical protein